MDQDARVSSSDRIDWEGMNVVEPAALDDAVLADQAQMLCEGVPVLSFNLVNASITAYVLHAFYPAWMIAAWLGAFAVVVAARVWHAQRYRSGASREGLRTFLALYTFGSTLTGCLWGASASLIWLTPDPAYHAFVMFVGGGMAAGAVMTNSSYLPAMFGFIGPNALPPVLALFAREELTSTAMGALLSAFTIVLSIVGLRANGWLRSVSRRRHVQEALAAALHQRNTILHAISRAATELTKASPSAATIPELLDAVGKAVEVDRIPILETGGRPKPSLLHVWRSAQAPAALDARSLAEALARSAIQTDPLLASLERGRPVTACTRTLEPGPARSFFESAGVRSALLVPIVVDEAVWGMIGFEDCRAERAWTAVEIDTLRILGDVLGGSIARQRYVDQLKDANEVVERSPTILFRLQAELPPRLAYVSRNIARFGYDPAEMTRAASRLTRFVHPDDRKKVKEQLAQAMADGGGAGMVEFRFRQKDGDYRWLDARYAPVRDDLGRPRLIEGVAFDVTERKAAAEKIERLASTDPLTGLANRRTFIEALHRVFAAAERGGEPFSLHYIDIDHFKEVNDTYGHAAGDALLEELASRLKHHCRASDLVARLGGDEFAILQSQVRDSSHAGAMAAKILSLASAPYQLAGGEARATVSIGVTLYGVQTREPDAMLAQADQALYCAKQGRDRYCFYSESLVSAQAVER
jgi:diguanylate cyclase (GGDEF)-like protein/PAS domain S-box-containing protein